MGFLDYFIIFLEIKNLFMSLALAQREHYRNISTCKFLVLIPKYNTE